MGAPTPLIMSEMNLRYLEYTYIIDILIKYGIIGYFRNVSHILIVYSFIQQALKKFWRNLIKFPLN
jgi:hypothetical protein